jgi:hypothetical protein
MKSQIIIVQERISSLDLCCSVGMKLMHQQIAGVVCQACFYPLFLFLDDL